MNAQTQIATAPQTNSVGLLNLEAFELSQRIAKMLASSTLVPEQYRSVVKVKAGKDSFGNMQYRDEENPNGLSNCIIALNMANRMGADPLMVMQNLYLIEGRPAWSSQFIMAAINSCGRFSALRFDLEDLGETEVEYQETVWENRQKKTVAKKVTVKNLTCVAWAIERETGERIESSKITMEMAVKEGWYGKNGSKWQTMPEQMLRYRAASFFGRVYAPELLMGLRSAEEEQDRILDVTPDTNVVSTQQDLSPVKKQILQAKTLDELDTIAADIEKYSDKEKAELDKLLNAQYKKYSEAATTKKTKAQPKAAEETVIEGAPTETSGEAVNANSELDELKRLQQEAEAVAQQKKQPSSAEMKKEYAKALNTAKSLADVLDIEEQIENDARLNQQDAQYLQANIEQVRAKFEKPQQQTPAVDPIKSQAAKNGLIRNITDTPTVSDLVQKVAPVINEYKPKLTAEDMNEVMNAYAARKKLLEDQQDMFDGVQG
ncbi:recombinase RecT [Acinetobacter indicus]|uniref:recombinase RecT n=1 Tax=Acinetobacter indicus TaxID=756892 RepID=UPI00257696C9|nr:recombinase RecT [Acinetobacter indicus]MDM1330036.1 recombinase RecT [Acinetobacter indicus]